MVRAHLKAPLRAPLGWILNLLSRLSARQIGLILVFHRVGDPHEDPQVKLVPSMGTGLFAAQMRLLKRRHRIVPAGELLAAVAARRRGRRIPVAVTFDDDEASHARTVMPILRRLGIPATFFLSGASLHAPHAFWYERLQLAFDRGRLDAAELFRDTSVPPQRTRSASVHDLAEAIKALPADHNDRVAERLLEHLGSDPPDAGIRAADARALASAGFEIGFHTRRHYILPGLDDRGREHARRRCESTSGAFCRRSARR